nr:ribonuclease H-like domain, reverse transcriptase, RNA-dependent DNA polymerase [Tanacetum cinerariifolium]
FMRLFGCPVTILNTLDPLEKVGEGNVQQYVLFPLWSFGSKDPQNTDGDATFEVKEPEFEVEKHESEFHVSPSSSAKTKKHDYMIKREAKGKSPIEFSTGFRNLSEEFQDFSNNSINEVNAASTPVPAVRQISTNSTNTFSAAGPSNTAVSPTHGKSSYVDPSKYSDDPNMPALEDITYSDDDEDVATQTRSMTRMVKDQGGLTHINNEDFHTYMFAGFLSQEESKRVHQALKDPSWIQAMQEELLQFKMQKVWVLVDLPNGKMAIGHTQEEGIDYKEVFAPVARIEAIRLFLAYASFMGFMVHQMDVKSTFLYGTIEEEVYVCQPLGFEDLDYPDKVYKVVKALYGLHQAPKAWYETLASYLLENGFYRGKIDQTLFIKRQKVKHKPDGILISQDKYVAKILRKFGLNDGKSASTPIDTEKPLLKDPDREDMDVHTYRSMIGSLMYLTSSRPDIMFAICACARFQVTPKASHLHAVKRNLRYLKGKPHLGLWYPKDSPFDLVAYSDSDYVGASLDRNSNIGGCQFLGCRLIFWQCKKQTVIATLSIEAEYVAVAIDAKDGIKVSVVDLTLLLSGLLLLRKKVIITEDTVREALHLDDAERIDCLPNEEIFTKLARMGYEKPSTKLTFYKAFFLDQWKFFIHTILQCMSAKRTAWNKFSSFMASVVICLVTGRKFNFLKYIFDSLVRNVDSSSKFYMYPRFLQLIIRAQVGDLSSHSIKYSSPALKQKVFSNMRGVGKGFFGVETPLFEGMLVQQQAADDVDDVVADSVPVVDVKPTPPSPTPAITPPPPQELPSTSQVASTLPLSPHQSPQQQPSSPP